MFSSLSIAQRHTTSSLLLALCCLIAAICTPVSAIPPQVLNATYEQKEFTVLGRPFQMTALEVNVDQELGLLQGTSCPQYPGCVPRTPTCDYTLQSCADSSASPSNCEQLEREVFCDAALPPYTTLTADEPVEVTVPANLYVYFRFYSPSPCQGFRVFFAAAEGDPDLYISTKTPAPNKFNHQWAGLHVGSELVSVCAQDETFVPGSFFISAFAFRQPSHGTLQVQLFDITPATELPQPPPSCVVPPAYQSGLGGSVVTQCAPDGVAVTGLLAESGDRALYYVQLTDPCPVVTVSVGSPTLNQEVDFDLYITYPEDLDVVDAWQVGFELGPDAITFSLCPGSTLYPENALLVLVEAYEPGEYQLVVSSHAHYTVAPVVSLPSAVIFTEQLSANFLTFVDGSSAYCPTVSTFSGCTTYWNHAHTNPLSPLPLLFEKYALLPTELSLIDTFLDDPEIQPTLLAGFLINSFSIGSTTQQVRLPEVAATARMHMLGRFTNLQGETLVDDVFFQPKNSVCSTEELIPIVERMQDDLLVMATSEDVGSTEVLKNLLAVDREPIRDSFQACRRLTESYLSSDLVQLSSPRPWKQCVSALGSDEYDSDPCCNVELLITECCEERETVSYAEQFPSRESDTFKDQCLFPNCSETYLRDYQVYTNAQRQGICLQDTDVDLLVEELFYIDCKEQILGPNKTGPPCTTDAQCASFSTRCDLTRNACLLSPAELETYFLRCFADGMSVFVESSLRARFPRLRDAGPRTSTSFVDALRRTVSTQSCVSAAGGIPVPYRQHLFYEPSGLPSSGPDQCYCTATRPDGYLCLDRICDAPVQCAQSVYDGCKLDAIPRSAQSTQLCEQHSECNWFSCARAGLTHGLGGDASPQCREQCLQPQSEFFCGICDNDYTCIDVPNVSSRSECENLQVCVLPDGTLLRDVSEEQCTQLGQCSAPCPGASCYSASDRHSVCYEPLTEEACNSDRVNGAFWNAEHALCVYERLNERAMCTNAGHQFAACAALSAPECAACENGDPSCAVPQSFLQCYQDPDHRLCEDRSSCENAGRCTDVHDVEAVNRFIPPTFPPVEVGQCLVSFTKQDRSAVLLQGGAFYCELPTVPTQWGCSLGVMTRDQCTAGQFVPLLTSEQDCEASLDVCFPDTYPFHGVANARDQEFCDPCSGSYKSTYDWIPGTFHAGSFRRPTWTQRQMVTPNYIDDSLNFTMLGESITVASLTRLELLFESQSLCTFTRTIGPVLVVSCSCTEHDVELCEAILAEVEASNSDIPVAKLDVCTGYESILKVSPSDVQFFADSLEVDPDQMDRYCMLATGGSTSLENHRVSTQVSLVTGFTRYESEATPLSYEIVYNENGGLAGSLYGDGVVINIEQPVLRAEACLAISPDTVLFKSFPIPAFGIGVGSGRVRPLDVKLRNDTVGRWCGELSLKRGRTVLFPVVLLENWEDTENSNLSSGEVALMYCSGAFYAALALATIIFFLPIKGRYTVAANYVVFVFCLGLAVIRSIYFFLVAAGVLGTSGEGSADYVLIELPTFFYMSAVGMVALSFAFFLLRRGGERQVHEGVFWAATLVFNGLIYLLFVVVVILMETLPSGDTKLCGGRIVIPGDDDSTIRTLRIVYKSIVGVCALIIFLGILFFGLKIWLKIRSSTVLQAILISFGLLCNCISFLIYYAINDPSPYFVISLYFTEILPLLALVFLLSPLRKKQGGTAKATGSFRTSGESSLADRSNIRSVHSSSAGGSSHRSAV